MNGLRIKASTSRRVATAWRQSSCPARAAWLVSLLVTPIVVLREGIAPFTRIGAGVAGALLATGALVDLVERRIPNSINGAALTASLVASCLAGPAVAARAVVGAVLAGLPLLALHLRRGVGLGDVKMSIAVGAACASLALVAVPVAITVAAGSAGLWGVVTRRQVMPLGPFLWLGWAVGAALGGR